MIQRFYAWLLPIKLGKFLHFDHYGIGWKWYGGYAVVNKDRVFRLEEESE